MRSIFPSTDGRREDSSGHGYVIVDAGRVVCPVQQPCFRLAIDEAVVPMEHVTGIQTTGIYRNEDTRCYEAWCVCPDSGDRFLVATCSMDVGVDGLAWWEQQVWYEWMIDQDPVSAGGPGR